VAALMAKPDTGGSAPGGGAAGSGGGGGPSTMCALVPLMPKELTPACRPPSHARSRSGTSMAVPDRSMRGLSARKCTSGGTMPVRRHSTALRNPATPAAASRCPMFVFTEPTSSGAPPLRRPIAVARASISIGSPTGVPVPCAST
jgi:hypothetical protein